MNTATRFTPEQGRIYTGRIGGTYKCLRLTPHDDAVMVRAEDGLILTVSGCRMYPDEQIDWCRAYDYRFAQPKWHGVEVQHG